MSEQSSTALPFGRAPRPASGADFSERLREALARYGAGEFTGLDRATIHATLDGPDLAALEIDLTGVTTDGDGTTALLPSPEVATRTPAMVRRVQVTAHPLHVMGARVDLRADAENLPTAWLESTDGGLWLELADDAAPTQAFLRAAANQEELLAAVRRHAEQVADSAGVRLTRLEITLGASGRRAVQLDARAAVRKGILPASARFRAQASLGEDMVLSLSGIRLSSGNPLVALALLLARGRIDTSDRRIDLNAEMPPGLRLLDAGLEVGTELVLTARLG